MLTKEGARAGAQWRTHAGGDEKELCEWDSETYRTWLDLASKEEKLGKNETGLGVRSSENASGIVLFIP